MTLKLYNTLTRKKEVFKPLKGNLVGIYSCGPTVYDFAHIGNYRAYLATDILKRYLRHKGFKVKHVMNITDVDDKTIAASQREGISLSEYTERYTKAFFEDIKTLNIEEADVYPRATENIKEMAALIKKLVDKGYAYKTDNGSVYYDISKFKNYGKLSHTKIKELKVGARVSQDSYEKENAKDFALWKGYTAEDGDVSWETEIGKGRPGWHIECSAMSIKYMGETFDIHSGGVDLVFPHHENEIAQSEAATGKKFVNLWFHNEHLLVDNKKMAKSFGNFYTLRDLFIKGYEAKPVRYLLISSHYRQKLNFSFEGLEAAKNAIERLQNFILKLMEEKGREDNKKIKKLIDDAGKKFEEKMDDDLNISEALAVVFSFITDINKEKISKKNADDILKLMKEFDSVLGIIDFKKENIPGEILQLVEERENARKNREWEKADKARKEIKEKGFIVEDTKEGPRIRKI